MSGFDLTQFLVNGNGINRQGNVLGLGSAFPQGGHFTQNGALVGGALLRGDDANNPTIAINILTGTPAEIDFMAQLLPTLGDIRTFLNLKAGDLTSVRTAQVFLGISDTPHNFFSFIKIQSMADNVNPGSILIIEGDGIGMKYAAHYSYASPFAIPDVAAVQALISAGGTIPANTIQANNTNAPAAAQPFTFKQAAQQNYAGTPSWDGTAPSGTVTKTYSWSQIGNTVTVRMNILYSVAGVLNTTATLPLPSDLPAPLVPTGLNVANAILYSGYGFVLASATVPANDANRAILVNNATNTGFNFILMRAVTSAVYIVFTFSYLTN